MKATLGTVSRGAVFYRYKDGTYAIVFPDLNDLATDAENLEDAEYQAQSLLASYFYVAYENGDDVPAPYLAYDPRDDFDSNAEENAGIVDYDVHRIEVNVGEFARQHNW